jgi:O-methyltransferase
MDGAASVHYIVDRNIEGDFIECGCGSGVYQMIWINALKERNALRHIHMFDTFAGLTEPSDKDYSINGSTLYSMSAEEVKNDWETNVITPTENAWCNWSLEFVKNQLAAFQYPEEFLHYIVGDVRKTLLDERNLPEKIAILRLDTDWYDSSKLELQQLFPRVVQGGLVIFDDYDHWNGQREATDEYFREIGESYTFVKVSDKTVAMIKENPSKLQE